MPQVWDRKVMIQEPISPEKDFGFSGKPNQLGHSGTLMKKGADKYLLFKQAFRKDFTSYLEPFCFPSRSLYFRA